MALSRKERNKRKAARAKKAKRATPKVIEVRPGEGASAGEHVGGIGDFILRQASGGKKPQAKRGRAKAAKKSGASREEMKRDIPGLDMAAGVEERLAKPPPARVDTEAVPAMREAMTTVSVPEGMGPTGRRGQEPPASQPPREAPPTRPATEPIDLGNVGGQPMPGVGGRAMEAPGGYTDLGKLGGSLSQAQERMLAMGELQNLQRQITAGLPPLEEKIWRRREQQLLWFLENKIPYIDIKHFYPDAEENRQIAEMEHKNEVFRGLVAKAQPVTGDTAMMASDVISPVILQDAWEAMRNAEEPIAGMGWDASELSADEQKLLAELWDDKTAEDDAMIQQVQRAADQPMQEGQLGPELWEPSQPAAAPPPMQSVSQPSGPPQAGVTPRAFEDQRLTRREQAMGGQPMAYVPPRRSWQAR